MQNKKRSNRISKRNLVVHPKKKGRSRSKARKVSTLSPNKKMSDVSDSELHMSADAEEVTEEKKTVDGDRKSIEDLANAETMNFYTNVGLFIVGAVTALTWLLVQTVES